ncbi:hypothetical protein RFI_33860, partial [Reticulomyxa filosa]
NIEEMTFENVWKKDMKVRRQFMCSNTPTIVVTNIKFKELKSECIVQEVLAHTFSGNFSTLVDVNDQQLSQLAHNFNDSKNVQIEQKDNSNGNQRIVKQPRCDIYRKSFAVEQKKKREEAVINPEINRYVLLRVYQSTK